MLPICPFLAAKGGHVHFPSPVREGMSTPCA
jgi:hypothetical protein